MAFIRQYYLFLSNQDSIRSAFDVLVIPSTADFANVYLYLESCPSLWKLALEYDVQGNLIVSFGAIQVQVCVESK